MSTASALRASTSTQPRSLRATRTKARPPRPPAVGTPRKLPCSDIPAESPELLHDLELDASSLARHAVPLGDCTRTGRFIDVATGKVILDQQDFALGSSVPLRFERVWLSCSSYRGPLGRGWHHAYDLALAHGADAAAVRSGDGRVVWLSAPRAGGTSYSSDERLTLWRDKFGFALRDAAGTEHRFIPHRARPALVLGARRTRDGQELRFGYDHRARLVRITDRRGAGLELDYDTHDQVAEIRAVDPLRAGKRVVLVRFEYDPRHNLRKAVDALGQARRYGYERSLLVQYDDRNGCSTRFEWDGPDSKGRCVHAWIESGVLDRRLIYLDGQTRVRNSLGHETTYAHDGTLVHRIVDPGGGVREFAHDPSRRLAREVDNSGREQRRVYDARGNLVEFRAADGTSHSFEYDDRDRLRRATDALNGRWEVDYDARGRLSRVTNPLAQVTQFHHRGRWLVGVTDPGGRGTAFHYDDAGNLSARVAADGCRTQYAYDAWGQLVGVIDPHGNHERREYDLLGRLVRVQTADDERCELSYDPEGNLVRRKDAQHDVRFTYQGSGRLSSRSEGGCTLCFEYDSEEQLVGILNEEGRLFRLVRGPTGAILETRGFDDCTRAYTRDAAGRIVRVESGGAFSEYEHDALGRVVEVQHSDGGFEGYRYRADGSLTTAWNQSVTLALEHDALGRLTREQQGEHTLEYRYDASGLLVELRSSLGTQQTFARDSTGKVQRIAEPKAQLESRIARDALGLEIERTLLGGGRSAWMRDSSGRPTAFRLENASGELVHKLVYEWEFGDRLRRYTDSERGTTEYQYDALGHLGWCRTGAGRYELRLPDAVGNVFARDDRRDRGYGPAGQLLVRSTRRGEVHCEYDARGNLIAKKDANGRRWLYVWSANGLLQGVTDPDGREIRFAYDAFGRRVSKRSRGETTRFLWAGTALVHEWVEAAGAPSVAAGATADEDSPTLVLAPRVDARGTRDAPVTWVYDPDTGWPLAKLEPANRFAIVTDHAGAPRIMLDAAGKRVWTAEASISGAVHAIEGELRACLLRGRGSYEDLETGLYCGRAPARYYDAAASAHICQGTIADRPKLRAYALAREPPVAPLEPELAPAHAWLTRVAALPIESLLPSPQPSLVHAELPPLMAAGAEALVDELLRRAFEEPGT